MRTGLVYGKGLWLLYVQTITEKLFQLQYIAWLITNYHLLVTTNHKNMAREKWWRKKGVLL